MSDPITAAAIGAGISGGTSLLQGKKLGTSLRDAAIGGALGGAGGYLGGAMGGAGSTATGATGNVMGEIGGANLIAGDATARTLSSGLGVAPTFADRAGQFLYTLPSNTMDAMKANPLGTASLGLGVYDRMNMSQAPLQPSPMLNAQQLMGQQGPVPTPQFNSLLQTSRRPILIG
jgi:hypothetical protein